MRSRGDLDRLHALWSIEWMNANVKEVILQEIEELLLLGQETAKQTFKKHGRNADYLKPDAFHYWHSRVLNLFARAAPPRSIWADQVAETQNYSGRLERFMGMLKAFRDAVKDGQLQSIEAHAAQEVCSDLLDQAESLVAGMNFIAGGMLCRAVLEEHLRRLCKKHDCLPENRPTIEKLKQSLMAKQIVISYHGRDIESMATRGNKCAHGEHVQPEEVRKLLRDVQEFLSKYPL
jgi:hypothetical protein